MSLTCRLLRFAHGNYRSSTLKIIRSDNNYFTKTELIAVLGQYELFTDRNTIDHLAWTIYRERGSHARVHPTQGTSRMRTTRVNEARGKSRHQNNSKIN